MSKPLVAIEVPRVRKQMTEDVLALKALRLLKGLSRPQAQARCGISAKALEQLENGRCGVTPQRIERIVSALGFAMTDFQKVRPDARRIIKETEVELARRPKPTPKLRRNYHRLITKEVRVLRILRRRRGLTQYQASAACGYVNSIFGQIENGRIELPRDRIEHIVRSLNYAIGDFDELNRAEILRDEMINRCTDYLENLEDHKLVSVQTVIKALMR